MSVCSGHARTTTTETASTLRSTRTVGLASITALHRESCTSQTQADRYLKSLIQNPSFYKHHLSHNSTLSLNLAVDVDNYFDYNLKQVDFVFNPNNTQPVIQFYYKLVTEYAAPNTEEEIRKKVEEELKAKEKSKTKAIYTVDENGNLNKVEL